MMGPGLGALRPVPWGLLGVRPGSLRGAAATGSARGGFAGGVKGAGPVLGATGRGGGRRGSQFKQPLRWRVSVGTAFWGGLLRREGEAPAICVL